MSPIIGTTKATFSSKTALSAINTAYKLTRSPKLIKKNKIWTDKSLKSKILLEASSNKTVAPIVKKSLKKVNTE